MTIFDLYYCPTPNCEKISIALEELGRFRSLLPSVRMGSRSKTWRDSFVAEKAVPRYQCLTRERSARDSFHVAKDSESMQCRGVFR